jgi:hypothetical protein
MSEITTFSCLRPIVKSMKLFLIFILCVSAAEELDELVGAAGNKSINCQGKKLPAHYFNDDYCDCPDGSDEPGMYITIYTKILQLALQLEDTSVKMWGMLSNGYGHPL